jgi:predicted permease
MTRLLQDLRYALRTFARAPGFVTLAILVLAIGIGANTAIFNIVNELLLRPLSGRAGELVGVYSHDRTVPGSYRAFSYPNYVDVRDRSEVFDSLMAYTFQWVGMPAGDGTRRTPAAIVSSNYFETLGVQLAAGRSFSAEEERPAAHIPVAIVTYARWKRAQLDPAFVGRTIRINAEDFTVVGVAPEGFTGTMALVSADVYLPLGMFDSVVTDRFKNNGRGLGDRSNTGLLVAGRIKQGLSEAYVTARLDAVARQLEAAYPAENPHQALTASLLPRMSSSPQPQSNAALTGLTALLMGLSGVVLIIACLNIANMLLARGSTRRKELTLRLALGARRAHIVRQLLTESVVLAITGAGLGLVLSYWATLALAISLNTALPFNVTFSSSPGGAVLAATVAFAALSTVAFGLGPALKLSRRDLVADLKDRGGDGTSGRRFGARNLMVIGQVALSLAMLTAAGIFARTALKASSGNPGYSYDRLLLASLDGNLGGFDEARGRATYGAVLNRLRSLGGATSVSIASTVSFGENQEGRAIERVGVEGQDAVRARTHRVIGADYFGALGLQMVRGREFTPAEEESPSAPRVAIVDEALARRLFGNEDPLGQMIRVGASPGDSGSTRGEPMQIVGIAPPLREERLDRAPVPHVFVPFGHNYRAAMYVHVRMTTGSDVLASIETLRREIRAVDPRVPVMAVSTMQAFHDQSLELWGLKTGARLFAMLGALALLLAVVGVYGVKSYVVSQRTREIGIRMALGASPRDVLGLVLRDGMYLTGIGVVIGLPLAVLVSIAFTKVFVDIGGFDPGVITLATVVLAVAATAASAVPARRATKVQPLEALQSE